MKLTDPNTNITLQEGDLIKLNRFDDQLWQVCHGWFSFGGNRPFCGWYLKGNVNNEYVEKPITLTDLEDVYLIKR